MERRSTSLWRYIDPIIFKLQALVAGSSTSSTMALGADSVKILVQSRTPYLVIYNAKLSLGQAENPRLLSRHHDDFEVSLRAGHQPGVLRTPDCLLRNFSSLREVIIIT